MTDIDNKLDNTETKGKTKNMSIVSSVPADDMWALEQLDEIAASQRRSRSYVALELLKKALPNFKGEIL